jgi:hypothetical protein
VTYIQRDQGTQIQFLLEALNFYRREMLGGELKHFIDEGLLQPKSSRLEGGQKLLQKH